MASQRNADSTEAVEAFLASLEHPRKREIEALRRTILGAHPDVREGVKWNAPSFRTTEYFATIHLRAKDGVGIVFHLGAKARKSPGGAMAIDDPTGLLAWQAKDRALASFGDLPDIASRRDALAAIVRQWVDHV